MIGEHDPPCNGVVADLSSYRYDTGVFRPGSAPSAPASAARLAALLDRFAVVMDLNMPLLELRDLPIVGRSFYGCNFSHSVLTNCTIRDCTFELCFFDFSRHAEGLYENVHAKNCVFACSEFRGVTIRGSDLIQCNFNAIRGTSVLFDDCDLFHSRFNASMVESMEITNCNVKEARFIRTSAETLQFKYANQEDAVFVNEEAW